MMKTDLKDPAGSLFFLQIRSISCVRDSKESSSPPFNKYRELLTKINNMIYFLCSKKGREREEDL